MPASTQAKLAAAHADLEQERVLRRQMESSGWKELLSASAESHATIFDAHFQASNEMWTSARALYRMLKTVGHTNPSIATELKPVEEWFRVQRSVKKQAENTTTTPATAGTTTSAATTAPAAVVTPAAASAVSSIVAHATTPATAPTTG
jgi:hypothetical protein